MPVRVVGLVKGGGAVYVNGICMMENTMEQNRGSENMLMCGGGQGGLGVRRAGIGVRRNAERVVARHDRARGCQDGLHEPCLRK